MLRCLLQTKTKEKYREKGTDKHKIKTISLQLNIKGENNEDRIDVDRYRVLKIKMQRNN